MRLFILAAVAAIGIALAGPAVAVPEPPQIPEWVIQAQAPDYVIGMSRYQRFRPYYAEVYKFIQRGGMFGGHMPAFFQRSLSDAYTKFADARVRITPDGGGTIEMGDMIVYGNNLPDVYRIQTIGETPQTDFYYKNLATQIHITISDGVNKITYLATPTGVQVLDASLPSIQANTSFVGLVGGTGVTISKNDTIRGLGVLADFVNAQGGEAGLCGGGRVAFMAVVRAILLDQNAMRETLASAIKAGKYTYRCEGSVVQLLF